MKTFFTLRSTKITGLAFLFSSLFAMNAAAQCPTPALTFPAALSQTITLTGNNTSQSIIAADFSGDGKADILTSNVGSTSISILLNNGSGVFTSTGALTGAVSPGNSFTIAAGDYTGDGRQDLAAACNGCGSVSVYPNTSTGTAGPITFGTPTVLNNNLTNPDGVVFGDFNGDGKQDLAVANRASSFVTVFLNTGSGFSNTGTNYAVGGVQYYVTTADFNGDGILDLATANDVANTVSVLLGNGDGTFQAAVTLNSGSSPNWLSVGDFNGDGRMDLVSANSNNGSGGTVSVFISNGTSGVFNAGITYAASSQNSPYGTAVADFNGDGKLDIVATDYNNAKADVLLGKGDGTFSTPYTALAGITKVLSICSADFNGDGKADIAVCEQSSPGAVGILLNSNTNVPAPLVTAVGNTPVCTLGTLTLTSSVFTGSGSGSLAYSWTGPNSFASAVQNPPAIVNPSSLAAGTYSLTVTDSRGCTGVASKTVAVAAPPVATASATSPVCTYGGISLTGGPSSLSGYSWSGPNGFTSALQSPTVVASSAAAGVYTLTVASAPGCTSTATTSSVTVTNAGSVSQSSTICAGQSVTVGTVVHNKTGTFIDDIKSSCTIEKTQLKVLFGNGGAPTFPSTPNSSLTIGNHGESIISGDFNHDGKIDLACVNAGAVSVSISVFFNNGAGGFTSTTTFTTGAGSPVAIAAADFNGDGNADLVSISGSGAVGTVSYFQSNGTGGFAAAVTIGTVSYSTDAGICTGDFNGDGNQDIAVTVSTGAVMIYFGNGAGGFNAGSSYPTGTAPYYVISADFNGDGRADLAVANESASTVSVLLGNGDGTFQAKTDFTVGSKPWWLAVGDFNNDGYIDLVSANSGANTVSVLINTGTAPFFSAAKTTSYAASSSSPTANNSPYGVTVADFNGDGKLDIAATDYYSTTGIGVLLGNGDGTFQTPYLKEASGSTTGAFSIVADDFDGNGVPDAAVAIQVGGASANSLVIVSLNTTSASLIATAGATASTCPGGNIALTGSPTGLASYSWSGPNGFTSSLQSPTISNVTTAAAGVYTLTASGGSGCSATATTSSVTVSPLTVTASSTTPVCTNGILTLTATPSGLSSYLWNGPNSYTSSGSVTVTSISNPTTAAAGVYTLTGISSAGCSGTATTAAVTVNTATVATQSVTLCAGQSVTVGSVIHNKTGTYIDPSIGGNGCTDIETTKLKVLYGNNGGAPTFQSVPNQSLAAQNGAEGIISADFSGDGKPDLATSNNAGGTVTVAINNGTGTFGAPHNLTVTDAANGAANPYEITAVDINGDGKADLITSNAPSGSVYYFLSNGDGTFGSGVTIVSGLMHPRSTATGDFNGDGNVDLAICDYGSNLVYIFRGNGSGAFTSVASYSVGTAPSYITAADLNGDGILDLATANFTGGSVSVLLGNGNGTFQTAKNFTSGASCFQLAVGDFNGDGLLDIASANYGANNVSVFINNGLSTLFPASGTNYPVTTTIHNNSPYGITCADFNGDGKLDLASIDYYNAADGVSMLVGNGDGTFQTFTTYPANNANATGTLSIVADDFNGDGLPDLAVGNQANTTMYIYFNTASPSFVATASATTPVCPTGTLTLTGGPSGLAAYSWSGPNSFTSSLQSPVITNATSAAAGVYTLTATVASGCSATANTASVVVSTITPTAIASTPVCTESSLTLAGGPAGMQTYSWTGPNGFTSSLQNPVIVHPTTQAAGIYSLTVTSTSLCTASASTPTVTINTTPTVFNQSFTICTGQSITVGTGPGITHNASGVYIDNITAKDGCDSAVVTTLKVIYGVGNPSFTTVNTIPTGAAPYVLATADFNNDGRPDLAVPNQNSNTVSILLGNGTGGFTSAANVTSNVSNPVSVASADFNGDGKADLVVANTGAGTISVYIGNGSGGFTPASTPTYSQGCCETRDIVCADFNNDGKVDLAVTSQTNSNITIYLGNGSGGFTVASGSPFPSGGTSPPSGTFLVNTADFNGDGNLDLAVVTGNSNLVEIFLGNGSGGFSTNASSAITVSSIPYGLVIADFNGDGKLDLATGNNGSNNVTVLLGNGTGGFGSATNYTVSNAPEFITIGDFNGDGITDIAAACQSNFVSILTGNGNGTFNTPSVNFAAGNNASTIVTADFNADGKPDLAVANYNDGTVTIMLNANSLANASATTPVCSGGSMNSTLSLTDNASGLTTYTWKGPNGFSSSLQNASITNPSTAAAGVYTLTATESHGCSATATTATVVINQVPPTFTQTVSACGSYQVGSVVHTSNGTYTDVITSVGGCDSTVITHLTIKPIATSTQTISKCAGQPVVVGAVTLTSSGTYVDRITGAAADGCDSIVTTNLTVLFGNGGSPTFSVQPSSSVASGPQFGTTGDFNGDGKPDVAVGCQNSNVVSVLINNGSGFNAHVDYPVGSVPVSVSTADFNHDGILDLAVTDYVGGNTTGNVTILFGKGNGTFQTPGTTYPAGISPYISCVADFNGDGNPDLAFASGGSSSSNTYVLLGNGTGGFGTPISFPAGGLNGYGSYTADFNGDGKPDIAIANANSGNVGVLINTSTYASPYNLTFAAPVILSVANSRTIYCGDFNGDNKIDLACTNSATSGGGVVVFLGNGSGAFDTGNLYQTSTNAPLGIGGADFNGDGKPDLVTADEGTNSMTVMLGNGSGGFTKSGTFPTGGFNTFAAIVADYNGDGKPDAGITDNSGSTVTLLLNTTQTLATLPTAGTNSPVCPNGSLILTGLPLGLTAYSWSGPNFYTATGQNPTLNGPGTLGAGVYTLTVTDSRGCTGTASTVPVVMNALPNIAVTPASAVCTGLTSAILTASGSVSGYTWSPSANLTTTNSGLTETAQISQLTFYTISGTGSDGCSNTTVVPVATVATGGAITPAFSIICSGGTKTLTVLGAAGHDYQWQISTDDANWTNITGATNTTYTTAGGDGNSNKFYRLMAQSNSCWNVASTTGEVDISNPNIAVSVTNITDNSLTLNWSPTGTGNYSVSYSGPTSATSTSVTSPKTITGLTSDGTYSITVTQTGVSGCAASGTITGINTLCAMPTGVTLSSPAPSQIQVSWTGVAGADYRVYYRPLFSYNTYFTKDVSNASSVLLTKQGANNIYASTTYEVYVSRLDCPTTGAVGQGTNPTNVTTLPTVTCATPVIDSVRSLCPVQIEVFIHDNGVNQYSVFIQRITPSILAVNSYGVSGTYFTINTPYSGDQYLIALEAKCGSALSSVYVYPGNVTVKPLCSGPTNLVLSNPTCHGFTASWNSDECLSNSASAYDFYLRVAGTINYNSYGVSLPSTGIGPHDLLNFLAAGRTYQVFVRSVYNCNGFVTYGPSSQVETITTLSSGCRDEEEEQPQENKPAVQQYSQDNNEVFSLYPNPNSGQFVVDLSRLNAEEDAVRIEVFNMLGQTVLTHLTSISDGHMSEYINMPRGIATGTYIVRLTAGKNVYTAKINISK